ncbi:hypothetical protein RHMOL_Rhmol06G0243800 [Rhododendron molle]|nr:hypothetical protein RHMOL_Rhmol06G0243800 [Rhododendron molle]
MNSSRSLVAERRSELSNARSDGSEVHSTTAQHQPEVHFLPIGVKEKQSSIICSYVLE